MSVPEREALTVVREKRLARRKNGLRPGALAVWAACVLTAGVLGYLTVFSADDYLYASFLSGGLRRYLSRLREHYMTFNGRVLVHVAANIILHFDMWLFAAVSAAVCAAIPALSGLAGRQRVETLALTGAVFGCTFLMMPHGVLSQGYYWISAFCNYALPTAMLCGMEALFLRAEGRRAVWLLGPALALACGATTEQSGLTAVAVAVYFFARALRKRRGRAVAAASLSAAAAGLATIFLSPATRSRFDQEVGPVSLGGFFQAVFEGFDGAASAFNGGRTVGVLLAALYLLTGALLAKRLRRRWPMAAGAGLAALAALTFLLRGVAEMWLYLALCALAALCAGALIALGREAAGLLTLTALAELAAVLPTDSVAGRTVLPFCLLLAAAVAVLAGEFLAGLKTPAPGAGALAALALAGAVSIAPFVRGFVYNRGIELLNREYLEEAANTGTVRYLADYDFKYTWTKADYSFSGEYLLAAGLDPEVTKLEVCSRRPRVFAGEVETLPSLLYGGEALYTIRIVEGFGIPVEANGTYDRLKIPMPWGDVTLTLGRTGLTTATWTDPGGKVRTKEYPYLVWKFRNYYPLEFYTEVLGLRAEPDVEKNIMRFTLPQDRE